METERKSLSLENSESEDSKSDIESVTDRSETMNSEVSTSHSTDLGSLTEKYTEVLKQRNQSFVQGVKDIVQVSSDNDECDSVSATSTNTTPVQDSGLGKNVSEYSLNSDMLVCKARYSKERQQMSPSLTSKSDTEINSNTSLNEDTGIQDEDSDMKIEINEQVMGDDTNKSISNKPVVNMQDYDEYENNFDHKNYSCSDGEVEDDVLITDLDSASNITSPAPLSYRHAESPRVEPTMHILDTKINEAAVIRTPRNNHESIIYDSSMYKQTILSDKVTDETSIQTITNQFEDKINKAIENIEDEEAKAAEEPRLSEEQLENLKQKCITRLQSSKDTEYTQNSTLNDFSTSKKLIKFLEESQEKDEKTQHKVKTVSYSMNSNIPKLGDLLSKSSSDLAEQVLNLHLGKIKNLCISNYKKSKSSDKSYILELEKEQRNISILKSVVDQSQEIASENVSQINKDHKQRLETLKKQYGATINRHQSFIDQLIADKKTISEKCESMATELRTMERRNKDNTKAIESRHAIGKMEYFEKCFI